MDYKKIEKDDVRRHLKSLGYSNISEEQLVEFIVDLKKFIRYEEKLKQKQKQYDSGKYI